MADNQAGGDDKTEKVFPGADESTPSLAQYFSWINNNWEGSTEAHTLTNLEFFKWLKDTYGMQLDIYAWDAGTFDGDKAIYGNVNEAGFKKRYPRGFGPSVEKARAMGVRMGLWAGPDGYGNTPEEGKARKDTIVGFCRDYNLALLKIDACCTQLRPEKQDLFIETLKECRKYSPDLILLNHRIELGKGVAHATTYLWEGAETYVDIHITNDCTATHHRAAALGRGLPPHLGRLTEDHGVCLSSCIDAWDDDLILQAFNRCLILAPEIYGNPWFLKDDEFWKLARIYNLHRRYRQILIKGMVLPEDTYGRSAVSRGDEATRFITLRNLSWNTVSCNVKLDDSIGLSEKGEVELRSFHPRERIIGKFAYGSTVPVAIEAFRSCLIMATVKPCDEPGVSGCDAQVIRNMPGKPLILRLLGLPGTKATATLDSGDRRFKKASIGGKRLAGFAEGKAMKITFPGRKLAKSWHRKLADMVPCKSVPVDAEALYEATCFAADNNALEIRSLARAGATRHKAVAAARKAFVDQQLFREKGGWDHFLFDGDDSTAFSTIRRFGYLPNDGPMLLRLDFGASVKCSRLVIKLRSGGTQGVAEWSNDLVKWKAAPTKCVDGKEVIITMPAGKSVRYLRLDGGTMVPDEAEGYVGKKKLNRDKWRASNQFAPYSSRPACVAWTTKLKIGEAAPGSYLCIGLNGEHGRDGAWVAARLNGKPIGCPDRAASFDCNVWESDYGLRGRTGNYTYYLPLTPRMLKGKLEIVALTLSGGQNTYKPEVWITSLNPFVSREVILE